ncbi:tRNA threonylcarbamoyladenosine dehydratase [Lachnospiraceae bacterium OttesenSCG-928-D06]|nr:tRNA threonylcarbamoyladenosine dehydratase [Lachnospiraceae bacterium OttesenSCG-928-D06]
MKEQHKRTAMLLGTKGLTRLMTKRVAVFGIGGVGGYVVEALVRSGIGEIDLIDFDKVDITNLNRQIIANFNTIGLYKTKVMEERIKSISKDCVVHTHERFYLKEERDSFPFESYDYIIDAIDTVTAKIDLAVLASEMGIPMISSMGTGNKLHPEYLELADIYKTSVCPLAKVMRKELKERGVKKLKVVYSKEQPLIPLVESEEGKKERKPAIGSLSFVPGAAGLIIAGEVVRNLCEIEK